LRRPVFFEGSAVAFEKLIEEFKQKTDEVMAMGGPEKLAKRKAEGHLNARERIDYLIDEGSFIESGRFARSNQPAVKHKTPADGKVAGFAKIDGRDIALVSNDFTVLGASSAVINMKKNQAREAGREQTRHADGDAW
jgi:acetyl-CoA carboxylase carboxyltransferase component